MEFEQIERPSDELDLIRNQVFIATFSADIYGKINRANDEFLRLIKWDREEVIGKMYFQDLLDLGGKIYYETHYMPLLKVRKEIREMNFELLRKDGKRLSVQINSNMVADHELTINSSVVDITKRKKYEEELLHSRQRGEKMAIELARLRNQLNKKNELIKEQSKELERLDTIKNKFFNVVSHDLKGPLCGLSGFVNMVIENIDNFSKEGIVNLARQIKESIDGNIQLADNLITWAQAQMKEFNIHPVIIHPEELIREVIELSRAAAQEKQIRLSYASDNRMVLFADHNQLTFVLRNLLNNAIKFTERGGAIKINIYENEFGESILSITDSGIGLTENQLHNLFLPNTSKTTLGTSGEKGTGLGLTLVEEFVHMHGGKIEVTSKKGEGSTFRVILNPLVLNEKMIAM